MIGDCPHTSPPHRHWWLEGYFHATAYGGRAAPSHLAKAYQTVYLAGYDFAKTRLAASRSPTARRPNRGLHAFTHVTGGDPHL